MNHKEITKQSYTSTADAYAANVANLAPLDSIKHLLSKLPPHPDIIDIGCGSGRDAKIFSDHGAKVTGIDFSQSMLEIAKKHSPTSNFLLMDIENMTFEAATFDAAWAACSLMHIPKSNFVTVLQKIHLFLKESGYLYLALKQGNGEGLMKDERYDGDVQKYVSFYKEEELRNYIEKAQFNILEFDLIEKSHQYQTHSAFRIVCQK
ncbi:MAG: class I SAM-dependent methyltransferase [Candidatus Berkiella sp.]